MCEVRAGAGPRKLFLVSVSDWSDQRMDVLSVALTREQISGHTMASSQLVQQQTGEETFTELYAAI